VEQIVYVVLGWLFGLLSPNIVERLRRPYERKELENAVLAELDEMRYTMASAAYAVNDHLFETSNEFLDWVLPVIRAYEGPRTSFHLAEVVAKIRALDPAVRIAMLKARANPDRGIVLKEYGLPFTIAKAHELRICSLTFQRGVFSIVGKVDMFNQQVRYLQRQTELTFDNSLNDPSRSAVHDNLQRGTRKLGEAARAIADEISGLLHEHSDNKART
jgi:hypothetical protein